MAKNSRPTDTDEPSTLSRNTILTRRSYVRSVAAVATAATATGVLAGTAVADEEYETITLDAGENHLVELGDGDSLENVLYDCTAEGARMTITAYATDWAIRNVGIEGQFDVGEPAAVFGVADLGGGSSTLENVYLGDGSVHGTEATGETGIWVSPEHNGHIDFHRLNVQHFPDNGIYASAPAGAGGGTVHIDECFAANNYISNFRIGSEGSAVTNSCVQVDESEYGGRGVWVWSPGACEIDNCEIDVGSHNYAIKAGANGSGTAVDVSNTDYSTGFHSGIQESHGSVIELNDDVGTDPDPFVPDGVPTSAGEAAAGSLE